MWSRRTNISGYMHVFPWFCGCGGLEGPLRCFIKSYQGLQRVVKEKEVCTTSMVMLREKQNVYLSSRFAQWGAVIFKNFNKALALNTLDSHMRA
jgi:hypothetical protein